MCRWRIRAARPPGLSPPPLPTFQACPSPVSACRFCTGRSTTPPPTPAPRRTRSEATIINLPLAPAWSEGDTVSYYIAAQDNRSRPNVALNPDLGASSYDPDPPRAGSPPNSPNTYLVLENISGNFTVGASGDYATLTAAVADLNNKALNGPVVFNLLDATYQDERNLPDYDQRPIWVRARPTRSPSNQRRGSPPPSTPRCSRSRPSRSMAPAMSLSTARTRELLRAT